MIKEVPCMECDGKGFVAKFGEHSVWSERCPNCGGTGIVKIPMTNADRIRAMSDEEMVNFLGTIYDFVEDGGGKIVDGNVIYPGNMLDWLQQPEEGNGQ